MTVPFILEGNKVKHCLTRSWVNYSTEECCLCVYVNQDDYYKIIGTFSAHTVSIFKCRNGVEDKYISAAHNMSTALSYVLQFKE